MTELSGKGVVLTGAASGIGRLMALRVADAGARLALWDIDEQGLGRLREELRSRGTQVTVHRVDLSDRHAIRDAAAATLKELGAVDVLINNAGIVSGRGLLEVSEEQIERTFAVNTLALFWTSRAFLPAMLERDSGHVVTIASAGGLHGTARLVDYCSSKFAAVGFDDSLRTELKATGSRVQTTVVCPYYIDTGMFSGVTTRFPWLLPILDPDTVTRRVVDAIRGNRRRVIMPWFIYTIFPMRLLPVAWADRLMDFFGVSHSMDQFTGRKAD